MILHSSWIDKEKYFFSEIFFEQNWRLSKNETHKA